MQEALPEDLWFFILLMALLILAYLWNDRMRGNNNESGTVTNPDRPPTIHVHSKGSQDVGEEMWLKASYDPGTGSIQDLRAKINNEEVGIREHDEQENYIISQPTTVQEGRNILEAHISTDIGEATDSTGFRASSEIDDEKGPTVRAEYSIIDEQQGHVRIEAESSSGTTSVVKTLIQLSSNGETVGGNSEGGETCVFEAEGLPPGNYLINAVAQDENGLTDEYTEAFTLGGSGGGPTGQGPRGGGGGGLPQGIFNPQVNFEPEINVDLGNQQPGDSGGSGPDSGYSGDNWSIFLQALRDSQMNSDVKSIVLDILDGNSGDYPVSILWVVRLMQIVESMQTDQVPQAAEEVAAYTRTNDVRNVSGGYFNSLVNILERTYTLERKHLEMQDNPYETTRRRGEVHEFFEETHEKLKQVYKEAQKIAELDEEAIEDFYSAMQVFERERALIDAFAEIDTSRLRDALDEGDSMTVKEIVQKAEQRAGVDDIMSNEEYLAEIKSDLETIEDNIREAHELLSRADNLVSDEYKKDQNIEESIQAFKGVYLNEIEQTIEVMERLTD